MKASGSAIGSGGALAVLPSNKVRRKKAKSGGIFSGSSAVDSNSSRILLAVACFWPLVLLALLASSSPPVDKHHHKIADRGVLKAAIGEVRTILDRVDVMGYGPTHPRVAVVIVGDDKSDIKTSVESVFGNTDMNRIFVVCVVVDGQEEDLEFAEELNKMSGGSVPHLHGLRGDIHDGAGGGEKGEDHAQQHSNKLHVLFNPIKLGMAASRLDGTEFIQLLEEKHENAGIKSPQEDIILLLLQSGAQLASDKWLPTVTSSLIVPPPILSAFESEEIDEDSADAAKDRKHHFHNQDYNRHLRPPMKLANAVSFNLEGPGKRTSVDTTFAPIISEPSGDDINLSSGVSYPTPALNGAGIAMRLDTFLALPAQDPSLTEMWTANLDLAFNLWLCGDGVDIIQDLTITTGEPMDHANVPLQPEMAARFVAAWMDFMTAKRFFYAYRKTFTHLTYTEWETLISKARASETFPKELTTKCRSFHWYAKEINTDITEALEQAEDEIKHEKVQHSTKETVNEVKPADGVVQQEQQLQEQEQHQEQQQQEEDLQHLEQKQESKEDNDGQHLEQQREAEKEDQVQQLQVGEAPQEQEHQQQPEEKQQGGEEQKTLQEEPQVREEHQGLEEAPHEQKGQEEQQKLEDEPKGQDQQDGLKEKPQQQQEQQHRLDEELLQEEQQKQEEETAEQQQKQKEEPAEQQQKQEEEPVEQEQKQEEEPAEQQQKQEEELAEQQQQERRKPSKPLCPECLEIIQKTQPYDISYVDVSGGHTEHPHMGATDENGNYGYVFDEKALRKNPPEFSWDDDSLNAACSTADNHRIMLTQKVYVDMEYDKMMEASGKPRDKIFCLVYTIEAGHSRVPNIQQTWGKKCDGFMVASNKTDVELGTVNIPHEGPEEYNNIWQKVRSMWSYIYDNYYNEYDWFHIGGDDYFLLVENFRYYLESEEIRTAANGGIYLPTEEERRARTEEYPLYMGRRFAYLGNRSEIFNSGGSGYTMNKAALKMLVVDGMVNFRPHAVTFSEDTMVGNFFRSRNVFAYETKDDNGAERYMPFMPGHHYGYKIPGPESKDWYAKYSINIKEGLDHCAARSIAFHYVKDEMMKRLYAILYHLCPAEIYSQ